MLWTVFSTYFLSIQAENDNGESPLGDEKKRNLEENPLPEIHRLSLSVILHCAWIWKEKVEGEYHFGTFILNIKKYQKAKLLLLNYKT